MQWSLKGFCVMSCNKLKTLTMTDLIQVLKWVRAITEPGHDRKSSLKQIINNVQRRNEPTSS
ncbi:hypothetical protein EXN66_Car014019 [Channa argus]|uniref:Uncharacterized protein n=1 Tax=Channa argus TaxID=215402 RepID=A0A6G1Q7U1_CHAAH|nr:hypothetical protein EXN66_Car014019 [Channa argus]